MNNCNISAGNIISHSVIGYNIRMDESCHLISQQPNANSIQSAVKGELVNTQFNRLGAILADNVHLGARTSIIPGCKIWPNLQTSINAEIREDVVQN